MRSALGHEDDLVIRNADGFDMDDVSWNTKADTTIMHSHSNPRTGAEAPPADLVADSIAQRVCCWLHAGTHARSPFQRSCPRGTRRTLAWWAPLSAWTSRPIKVRADGI